MATLSALILLAVLAPGTDVQPQVAKSFTRKVSLSVSGSYLLYLPEEYGKTKSQKYPLVLFLHGAGETGSDINMIKMHGVPKEVEKGRKFPFIAVSPQTPQYGWDPIMLTGLLDEIEAKYRVDKDREYVTGLSMGGFGTFALAALTPDRFAAVAPICGGANANLADKLKTVPIWSFHGGKDPVVPLSAEKPLMDRLIGMGAEAKLTVIPEGQHDVWTDVYASNEVFDWLLKHKRRQAPKLKG